MTSKSISHQELKRIIKNKKCNTPWPEYLAIEIFNDPDHPIADIHTDDIRLSRDLFKYLILSYEEKDSD